MIKYILFIAFLLLCDTLTKIWAGNFLQSEITIIPSIFSLLYVENTWIAFSIPITGNILKVMTLVLIFIIFWYYWKEERWKNSVLLNLWYSFIFAWALWNAWERLFRWYVTDFLSLEYFAVFNLADSYISIWAAILLYFYFRYT